MRSFQDITKELALAMDLVVVKKDNLAKVVEKATAAITKANEEKVNASSELIDAQNKAGELRKEYDQLMTSLLPPVR